MDSPRRARFEDIASSSDADVQVRLSKVKDLMIAAALVGAPPAVSQKLVNNLSLRRRAAVGAVLPEARKLPSRTREVAREVVTCAVFDLPPPDETPSAEEVIRKAARENPNFEEARKARKEAAAAAVVKRWLAPRSSPKASEGGLKA